MFVGSSMEYYIAEIEGEGIYISNTDSNKQRSLHVLVQATAGVAVLLFTAGVVLMVTLFSYICGSLLVMCDGVSRSA